MNEIIVLILFLISFLSTFFVDISGAIGSFKLMLGKGNNFSINPTSNRLCITFWICIIFLLITGFLAVEYIAITCIFCALLEVLRGIVYGIAKILTVLIRYITRKRKGEQE